VGGGGVTAVRRGAIVGAGGVARLAHIPAYRMPGGGAPRLELVAAIDALLPAADIEGLPVRRGLADLEEFAPVDFVDICTPTATHQALTAEALERGMHVFCEKPVAVGNIDAARLTAIARRTGRVLFPCHQYRENPAWRAIRGWLDAGAIGRWHLAEFNVYRPEADRGAATGVAPWRGSRAQSLGGVLLDHGTHLIYLLLDVAGMPRQLQAHLVLQPREVGLELARLQHGYDVEDTARVLFDWGDRIATLKLSWAGGRRENRAKFVGDQGTIDWVAGVVTRTDRSGAQETLDFSAELDKQAYAGWVQRVLTPFADAIDGGDRDAPLREIEQVAGVLDAAYHAAESGCRVTL